MENELHEMAVQNALSTRWVGRSYHYVAMVGSTNDRLKELAAAGKGQKPPAGTVLATDFQSQGRGRLNRRWEAPPGTSLLFSILFRPGWPAERANWLTMLAGLAAVDAVTAVSGVTTGLKWPNDLMVSVAGAWRKAGGLLLEGNLNAAGCLESAVLGIGINVNMAAEQLPKAKSPATSLLVAGNRPVSRLALLVNLLQQLEAHYEAADGGRTPRTAWARRLVTLGRPVQVTSASNGQMLNGVAEDVDGQGQLLVRDRLGQLHTIAAGDVTLCPTGNFDI